MEATITVQEQARELLATCADAIKNGSWICGAICERKTTDAPRNNKPPGCAVGLLGIWSELLPVKSVQATSNPGFWTLWVEELNPSEWKETHQNYKPAVEALYALARAIVEERKSKGDERWENWDEGADVYETENYVIQYNDDAIDSRGAKRWFRNAILHVR